MRKLLRRRKRGTFTQEIVSAVAQVVFGVSLFATFRGGLSVYMTQPPYEMPSFFALFSPTFGAVCLLVGPLVAAGALLLRLHLAPKD